MIAATVRWIHSSHAWVVVERRQDAVVAQRPVGAAHARAGGADDDADRHEQDRRRDGGRGELLEAGHGAGPTSRSKGRDARAERRRHSTRTRRGRIPRSPATLCACPDRSPPSCSPCSRSSSPPAGRPPRPARRPRPPPPGSSSAGKRERDPGHRQHAAGRRAQPVRVLVHRPQDQPAGGVARPDGVGGVHRARRDRSRPGRPGDLRVGDRGVARRLRGQHDVPRGRRLEGRVRHRRRRTSHRRRSASGSTCIDKATTVGVGQPAPSTTNPVAADVGGDLAKISSDPKPDPAFYQTTVADALAAHKPFVLVFATPAFCTSAQCGPTLDRVKAAAAAAPKDVEFINVEPYQLTYAERQAPARPRREQPAPDGRRVEQVGPGVGAVDLHGGLGRDREGLVRGRGRRRRAQGGDRGDRG